MHHTARETTVAASLFIDLATQLEATGIDAGVLCRRARVDTAFLTRPHDRLPGSAAERLWEAAVELTGDPLIGLHLTEHYRTGAINILGYVLLNCATGRDVLERLGRYAGLLNDGLRVRTSAVPHDADALVVVHFEPVAGLENVLLRERRQVMETIAAGVVLTLRGLTGRRFVPDHVWFAHAARGSVAEYHRVFGTAVRFEQAENRVALRASELAAPIPNADPSLLRLFDSHAGARLDELERPGATTRRVVRLLTGWLTGTAPDVRRVARALAMSARQLQRALHDEGTSYQALLDEVRRERAVAQLRTPGVTASEVALLLGFSEASAFTRAFRRWRGTTPSAWSAAARNV